MPAAIRLASALFFASGAAALVFEALWFRRAGLAFGNSVWASALVLSSFMTGMALGYGAAARIVPRLRSPLRAYFALEIGIAIVGVALVVGLPALGPALAPLFRPLLPDPASLQLARFACAFLVMVLPAVAMGATLPVLVHALRERDPAFGHLLGRLYGWNTLGAMAGAASAELVWIPLGGIYGAAAAAASLNVLAGCGALALRGIAPEAWVDPAASAARARSARLGGRALRLLAAAAGAGAIVLAFEVVWFRVVIQYLPNSSAMFAWMLAIVLGGIAGGSLLAGRALRLDPGADRFLSALALFGAALAVLSYAAVPTLMDPVLRALESLPKPPGALWLPLEYSLLLCGVLMLPVSIVSGALFAMLGARLHAELDSPARATGLLALVNSGGAALGPLLAGFVLLPMLGVDRSTWLLAAGYLLVAALAWNAASARAAAALASVMAAAALALFPFGRHESMLVRLVRAEFGQEQELVALREGIVETAVVTRTQWRGETLSYRLVTDGYSMSGSSLASRRYMRLFAYLPAAFHPKLESAVLISFGVGNTAAALTELAELEAIRVVDISPEILQLAEVIHPEPGANPLLDPRVRVHVEDGRYFLQTTPERFDLITAEPPPPAFAGVVDLYTREYFELLRERLNPGGFASYWLPVSQMRTIDAQAIMLAFCDAFPDCSLWEADPADWILLGSRDAAEPTSETRVRSLWSDPRTGPSLRGIGVESPAALGALFLADASFVRAWAADAKPLVDAHPQRAPKLAESWVGVPEDWAWILDQPENAARFASAPPPISLWPESLRAEALAAFEHANLVRGVLLGAERPFARKLQELHSVLSTTQLRSPVLWILDSGWRKVEIARAQWQRGERSPELERELAAGALAERRYAEAAQHFAAIAARDEASAEALLAAYALLRDGRAGEASELAHARGLDTADGYAEGWNAIQQWVDQGD